MYNEVWKEIENTNGRYLISNTGKVWSVKRNKYLTPKIDRYGYKTVLLWINYDTKIYTTIHRLVAKAFCENPFGLNIVNHKDLNKLNNNADNLEWCTVKDNVQHWYMNDINAEKNLKEYQLHSIEANSHTIKVWQNGVYIGVFTSKQQCAKELNISEKTIYNAIRNKHKNKRGYVFELIENPKYKNNAYKKTHFIRKRVIAH